MPASSSTPTAAVLKLQAAVSVLAHLRGGMDSKALRVGRAVQRECHAIGTTALAVLRSFSTGPQPLVIVVQARSLRYDEPPAAAAVVKLHTVSAASAVPARSWRLPDRSSPWLC